MEAVIFLIEFPHMKHEHCFAVKVDKKENIGRNTVDSHCVGSEFDGSCDNVDPHVGNEVVGHMDIACFVRIFCIVGAHKIEKQAESCFGKKCNKMVKFVPKHNEAGSGTNHGSHNGKGKTTGFAVKVVKACSDKYKSEEVKKSSDFAPDNVKRSKHKAHTGNDRDCAFKFKLVFSHFNIPLKSTSFNILLFLDTNIYL